MNYPYSYIFTVGFCIVILSGWLTHHLCGVFHIMTSDNDSPDWEQK